VLILSYAHEKFLASEERALRLCGAVPTNNSSKLKSVGHNNNSHRAVNANEMVGGCCSGSMNDHSSSTQSRTDRSSPGPKCAFCSDNEHFIEGCNAFKAKNAEERLKWYNEERRCYSCARRSQVSVGPAVVPRDVPEGTPSSFMMPWQG